MKPALTKTKWSWAYSLVVWLMLVLYVAPLLVAWNLWDPLDTLPYWICSAVGAAAAWMGFRLWPTGRTSFVGVYLLAWAPTLAIGLGLGSNVLLDQSLPVPHATRFLGLGSRHKGPSQARFASWREPGSEERVTCTVGRMDQVCSGHAPGSAVVVTTRRGALGWEWIESIAH